MKLSAIPFVRFAIALVAGVLFEINGFFTFQYTLWILMILFIFYFTGCFLISDSKKTSLKPWFGALAMLWLFFFGIALVQFKNPFREPSHIIHVKETIQGYEGIIDAEVEERTGTYKSEIVVTKVKVAGQWKKAEGEVLVYFYKNDSPFLLHYGDILIVSGGMELVAQPLNPDEFNLKKMYGFRGIAHRHFLNKNQYELIGHSQGNPVIKLSLEIKEKVNEIFREYINPERERNIASALILGIKNPVDIEILQAYSATGTIHVLAVSGLHVGIIYGLLLWLTGFIKKVKYGNIIQALLLILILWFYAVITGLCPSVLRAVTMLTFVITANISGKRTDIFNMLFLTAFVLLCFDPFIIMEVGFQLSFLAVLGIIYIHPRIYSWFEFDYPVADWIWSIACMSVAAQLATFPLGLFYFHQFPNYFLLSNLVVIPAALAVMYIGFTFLTFCGIPLVAQALGWLIGKLVWLLNYLVLWIESLPLSTITGISLSGFQTLCLYAIITSMLLFLVDKKFGWILTLFGLIVTLSFSLLSEIYAEKNQHGFVIYQVNKRSGIDFIDGQTVSFLSDNILPYDKYKMRFHIMNHRWTKGISSRHNVITQNDLGWGSIVVWNGLKILIIDKERKMPAFKQKLTVDYVVLQNNAIKNLDAINSRFNFKKIIRDGSNKKYVAAKAGVEAKKLNLNFYDTAENGAFIVDMNPTRQ